MRLRIHDISGVRLSQSELVSTMTAVLINLERPKLCTIRKHRDLPGLPDGTRINYVSTNFGEFVINSRLSLSHHHLVRKQGHPIGLKISEKKGSFAKIRQTHLHSLNMTFA